MPQTPTAMPRRRPVAGLAGFALGAAALLLVLVHFWAGPFAPQQNVGVSLGDLAAEMRESALRGLAGEPQPAPEPLPWDIDRVLEAVSAALAGLAIVAALAGLIRHEARRPAVAGIALGIGAVTFQLVTWAVLVLAGAILIYGVAQAALGDLGDIFD